VGFAREPKPFKPAKEAGCVASGSWKVKLPELYRWICVSKKASCRFIL